MFVGSIPNIPKSFHDPPGSNLSPSSNIMQLSPSSCLATIPLFGQESTHPAAASASFWKAWLPPQTIWHHYFKQSQAINIYSNQGRSQFFPNSHLLPSPYLNF